MNPTPPLQPLTHIKNLTDWLAGGTPLEIDVGCHKGLFVSQMAARHPGTRFLGIERKPGRVLSTCRKLERLNLPNAAVVCGEGEEIMRTLIADASAAVVHVSFPDPWPKRRHETRRMINRSFVEQVERILVEHGVLRMVTDDLPYFEDMCRLVDNPALWEPAPWDDGRCLPQTEFARKSELNGRAIHRIAVRRRPVIGAG